jgi:hypothetical protein
MIQKIVGENVNTWYYVLKLYTHEEIDFLDGNPPIFWLVELAHHISLGSGSLLFMPFFLQSHDSC